MLRTSPSLFELVLHLFHDVYTEFAVPTEPEKRFGLHPFNFAEWLRDCAVLLSTERRNLVLEALPETIREEAWAQLIEFSKRSELEIASELQDLWPTLTLANRKTANKVASISASVVIRFADGKMCLYPQNLPAELLPIGDISTAVAANFLTTAMNSMISHIATKDLDGCHAEATDMGGEYPFKVLMGACISVIKQLDPTLHESLERYTRMAHTLIHPPLTVMKKTVRVDTELLELGQPKNPSTFTSW